MPVTQIDTKTMIHNREGTLPTASFYDIGEEIPTEAVATSTPVTTTLKRLIGQWDLDNFITNTYRDPNQMKAIAVSQANKGVARTLENKLIYGSTSNDAKEFDGIIKLTDSGMRTNMNAALSVATLRKVIDDMKYYPNLILVPRAIGRRLNNTLHIGYGTNHTLAQGSLNSSDLGPMVSLFEGIPIVETDYLTLEASNGLTQDSGGADYSVLLLHFGPVEAGGVTLCLGNPLYEYKEMDLHNKDAMRYRITTYAAVAIGSATASAQIYGITDAAVTA